ncbi:MAG: SPOR domain-containing protein [Candidatus Omnitrophica bacterium]|nr:SPOR domain-containing protein [Candidatus Omnitrophota bacterium]MDD5549884.1 SPOR domain-containing protein [Candidatus Omnitrophota bacterium]
MSQKQIQLEIFNLGTKAKREPFSPRETSEQTTTLKFPTQLCIKIACLMILLIISFALGIERGKILAKNQVMPRLIVTTKTQETTKETAIKREEVVKQPVLNPPVENTAKKVKDGNLMSSNYIIQVATYKKNSSFIKKEASKLQQKGYNTVLIGSGEYMQVCAGKFTNKKDATEHLNKLKQTYKDCFIRKI